MSIKASINPIKVPHTPVECPKCSTTYKEKHPQRDVENGHSYSECPNGHVNEMEIIEREKTIMVLLSPLTSSDESATPGETNRSTVS